MSRTIAAVRSLAATGLEPHARAWRAGRYDAAAHALLITAMASVWFLAAPAADVAATELFHVAGQGFPLAQEPVLKALRKSSSWVMGLTLAVALGALARAAWTGGWRGLGGARRAWCAVAGLALGPGLLVNLTLKEFWGRPRPVHLEMFGGEAPYVPVWEMSDWCRTNCSFTSGEGASAAWMAAAVLFLPSPWRERLIVPALSYAVALSLNRVAFGGHFISDVVLSWSLTAVVMGLLYAWMAAPAAGEPERWALPMRR